MSANLYEVARGVGAFFLLLISVGCATQYQMLLKDGSQVLTKGRPETRPDGSVHYRDETGTPQVLGRGWVFQIEPYGSTAPWGASNGPDSDAYVNEFQLRPTESRSRTGTEFIPRP